MKSENLKREELFMLRQLELSLNIFPRSENRNPYQLSFEQKREYFKMLNQEEMKNLYRVYKVDFDLFEYDPDIFQ